MHLLLPPTPLLIFESLRKRKGLTPQEELRYEKIRKGFFGEKNLEKLIKESSYENIIPLFDCLFSIEDTEFQIDCLLLTSDSAYLIEVKNYTGDYYLENNKLFYLQTKLQVYNPIAQLERSEFLFKRLLNKMGLNIRVQSHVFFINYDFVLYGAIVNSSMIFPSQIKDFLKRINANSSYLNKQTTDLAHKLLEKRLASSNFERLPVYEISEMKKGVFCEKCSTKLVRYNKTTQICLVCENLYSLKEEVLFAIAQYYLLFPDRGITVNAIFDWCGACFSKGFIRRILTENFKIINKQKETFYSFLTEEDHLNELLKKYKEYN